ncbi:unnamed protein product [Symbiodinium sp. CCMP2592]|nr:unnamed protein product [Symbiodinium sp. CCMP2592]
MALSEPNPFLALSEKAAEQASPMRALLEGSGIPESLWKDVAVFAPDEFGSLSDAEIQEFLDGLTYPAQPSDLLVKARIRLLWRKCQKSGAPLQPDPPKPNPVGSTGALADQASWSEAFPKRLSGEAVRQMIKAFSEKYPSEPLSPEIMPSPRLLSLVHQQLQDRRWRWIPWKLRLSEEQYDSKSLERSLKAPRLANLLWEEIPSRELPTQGMAKSVMAELLHLQAVAIALADGAHLYTLREMNRKFLVKCFDHLPRDGGLRVPNRLEAENAEKQLWQQIAVLFNEENWTMDQAIREVVVARNELHVLLMPRAVAPKIPWQPWTPHRIKGDGKQGNHGKGGKGDKGNKGGSKDGKGSQRHTLMSNGLRVGTSWMQGKNKRLLCSGFQQGKCTRDQCKFEHVCGAGCMSQPLVSPQSGVVLADVDMSVLHAAEACEPMHTGHTVCFEPQSDAEESNLDFSGFPQCASSGSALATFSEVPPVPAAVDAPSTVLNATCAAVADPSSAVSAACDTILNILQSVDWPPCHTARAVLQPRDNDDTGYWNFGVRPSEPTVLTSITQDKPDVVRRLNALFKVLWPDQFWNAICINLNRVASLHQDLANSEGSMNLNVSVGDFQGGALWLESATGTLWRQPPGSQHWIKGEEVQTFRNPISFPACAWHETMPFVGNRWSITCYTLPHVPEGTLAKLGFPEVSPAQVPDVSPIQASAATSAVSSTAPISALPPVVATKQRPLFFLDLFAGASAPLCQEAARRGWACIPIDILHNKESDLRDDRIFDGLLKLSHSGAVAFANASPPCCEYSIVKQFDGGPPPCRSWEYLGGFPSNNAEAQERVQSSHLLLSRAVMLLHAVFQSGNHVSLEQPRNSMAWAEPVTQAFLLEIAADVIQVAACSYGSSYAKYWAFATSWRPLQQLQSTCQHAVGHHDVFHGKRDATGQFVSRHTALFPPMLCNAFMEAISPLFPESTQVTSFTSLNQALSALPIRPLNDFPTGQQDGGGIYSQPDWTSPPAGQKDTFRQLRQDMWGFFKEHKLFDRLRKHVSESSQEPLIQQHELPALRAIWEAWFRAQGFTDSVSWEVAPDQPYCLQALELLSKALDDRDVELWKDLQAGVPTGVDGDISMSHCFLPTPANFNPDDFDVQVCSGNWPGANEEPELLAELVQKEVDKGYVHVFDSLEEAQAKWSRVAVGKVNVVKSGSRDPRLIVDPSVSGVNPSCHLPERFLLPGLGDIRAVYPLRGVSGCIAACTLDIQAAHKTVRIRASEQGLLGFSVNGKYYFYKVAPFGGSFSALWWQRVAGFYVRTGHRLIFISHVLLMYVDDALLLQHSSAIDFSALLMVALSQSFGYPISWRKLQLGPKLEYIGWRINFRAGTFCLPDSKVAKLLQSLMQVLRSDPCTKRDLQALIGLLHWVLQMSPELLPWLCCLYHDMSRSNIPPGSKLLSARHVEIKCKADLRLVRATGKRVWIRVADASSSKRRISTVSRQFIMFWVHFCMRPQMPRCLSLPPLDFQYSLAADACAKGNDIGIGGWVALPDQPIVWFSEWFTVQDFRSLGLPMKDDANLDITAYETLAQLALLVAFISITPTGRLRVCIPSWSDNSGTESLTNKLFTVHTPLCFFAQKLATRSWQSGISLDCTHIAGCHNDSADFLSRWKGDLQELPSRFSLDYRVRCPLTVLWEGERDVRVFPPHAKLLWQPPVSSFNENSV